MRTVLRPLALLPLLAVLAASATWAADPPARKEGSFGGGKASGAYLTREQLRGCMARQAQSKSQDAELVKEQADIAEQKGQITRTGDALKSRLDAVDRTSAEAVAAYNEAVQNRDKQIDAYQARVDAFNARVDANQAEHAAFGQACANRRFFEDDEIAIRKGK